MLHIGLDTVKLNGQYFDVKVKDGQKVAKGDLLVAFDREKIREAGYKTVSPIVVLNSEDYKTIRPSDLAQITTQDAILTVESTRMRPIVKTG